MKRIRKILYNYVFCRVIAWHEGRIDELKDKARHYPMMVALLESDRKEIAELKRQIEFLKITHSSCGDCNKCADGMGIVFDENLNELKAQKAQLLKMVFHHKFKRCLAMAWWCEAEAHRSLTEQSAIIDFPEIDRFQYLQWNFTHFSRWHRRWLKLAKKFKEAK